MTQLSRPKLIYIATQSEFGGAQRYIFDLANELKNTFDITVASGSDSSNELLNKCQAQGIKTHKFQNLVREIHPFRDIAAVKELAEFFRKEKPDITHLNSSKAGVIGAAAKRLLTASGLQLPTKIIYTAHGWVFNEPMSFWRQRLYRELERFACSVHNRVIVLSKYDYETAIKNKVCPPEKLVIIPHGIKPINFFPREEARNKLTIPYTLYPIPSAFWIGTIANLYKTKGINYLIDAASKLVKENLKPNFIVIGEGPEHKKQEAKSRKQGLNNFYFIGKVPQAAKYLKAFDIFILPSVKEGMPYAILEAMQAGLPIIATRVGAIPEMIENEKSGLIIPPKDSQAPSSTIKTLLENAPLREKLGKNAQNDFMQKFNFQKMIEKTMKVYTRNSVEIQ